MSAVKPYVPDPSFYATDKFTDWALGWLDEEQGRVNPFSLCCLQRTRGPCMLMLGTLLKLVYDVGYESIRKERYQRQLNMGLFEKGYALLIRSQSMGSTATRAGSRSTAYADSCRHGG